MQRFSVWAICLALTLTMLGCSTAVEHRQAVMADAAGQLSAGKVQREIRVGMASSDVAEALGSPNVVATDESRREVWVYDRIATEHAYSTSSGGVTALILAGFTGSVAGGGGVLPNFFKSAGASSTSQRTLTVIIKFSEDHRVRDFAYRQSSF
jgi:outer membrane protein assembly factor BamE (lipoprotein component of BamABCDE complex)